MNKKLVHTIIHDFETPIARLGMWVCSDMLCFLCVLKKNRQVEPGTTWYSHVEPIIALYIQVLPETAKYSLVQPNTAKYSLFQPG